MGKSSKVVVVVVIIIIIPWYEPLSGNCRSGNLWGNVRVLFVSRDGGQPSRQRSKATFARHQARLRGPYQMKVRHGLIATLPAAWGLNGGEGAISSRRLSQGFPRFPRKPVEGVTPPNCDGLVLVLIAPTGRVVWLRGRGINANPSPFPCLYRWLCVLRRRTTGRHSGWDRST